MKKDTNTTKTTSPSVKPREVHHPDDENGKLKINNKFKNEKIPDTQGLVKNMSDTNVNQTKSLAVNIIVSILVVIGGVFSGWGLSEVLGNSAESSISVEEQAMVDEETVEVGSVYGNQDKDAYADSAEGVLLKGGIDGEGSHRILRPGGKTQTVYLTSSVVDLSPLVGHMVKVSGDTFAAQKANWLMDVGRIEVLELDAEKPFEEVE